MQLNHRILSISFLLAVSLLHGRAFSQEVDTCSKVYNAIVFNAGRGKFTTLDSLFSVFNSFECYKDKYHYQVVLGIMKQRWLEDGYQVNKADSIQALLGEAPKPKKTVDHNYFFRYRAGLGGAISFPKHGSPAFAGGMMAGFRDGDFGIDIGVQYQKFPFLIKSIDNKTDNNYSPDGYILKAKGNTTFYQFPVKISYFASFEDDDMFAVAVGAMIKKAKRTFIKEYYHEYGYSQTFDPVTNRYIVTYKSEQKSGYEDNSFFTNQTVVDFFVSADLPIKLSDPFMLVFTPAYNFNLFNKLQVANVGVSVPPNHWSIGVSVYYLFGKKKIEYQLKSPDPIIK